MSNDIWGDELALGGDFATSVKGKYGFLPTSVWYCTKQSAARQFIRDNDAELKATKGNQGGTTSMSEFDPEVADRIIKYWSNKGDQIVDPFCGRATRAICSMFLGRNYQGYEISPKHHAFTMWRMAQFLKTPNMFNSYGNGEILLADGVHMDKTPAEYADLIMTCPPYWNIEKYESVPGQLSDVNDYNVFMNFMEVHAINVLRVLKKGGFAVYVVNDFRRDGVFYPWHMDMINAFTKQGLTLHDIAINKVNSVAVMGVGNYEESRRLVKMHEYILVFTK